jgi:hypothetical protein
MKSIKLRTMASARQAASSVFLSFPGVVAMSTRREGGE